MQSYQQLKKIFKRLAHLTYVHRIMTWDDAVMMPAGAGQSRGHAVATLSHMMHKMLTRKKIKQLLASAKDEGELGLWDSANLKWMEKEYLRASSIPASLTEKITKASMASEQAWRLLREKNNWREFEPLLAKTFALVKEKAEREADIFHLNSYDVLIDQYAPGFNQQSIDAIFAELKKTLPPLMQQIIKIQAKEIVKPPVGPFPIIEQQALGLKVMKALQFDFNHGRLDISHHPFCSGIQTDVRITTRYREDEFLSSLEGICHETGHALYEQGMPKQWIDQPVGQAHSMAMHESQSLLVEMQVCRSQSFFQFITPLAQEIFGRREGLTAENLYQLATRVKASLIRVDADEVSYPLHIILRYEIEKGLFNGDLAIHDLPHWWDEQMQKYLGISTKGNDKDGVMQDVHWAGGAFGYFPAYTLGRLIGAQFFASFLKQCPKFFDEVEQGNFRVLKTWLNENVHAKASAFSTEEILRTVTGEALNPKYFIDHIKQRYARAG